MLCVAQVRYAYRSETASGQGCFGGFALYSLLLQVYNSRKEVWEQGAKIMEDSAGVEKPLDEQIQFARLNFENQQALIRFADAKAGPSALARPCGGSR